MTDGWSVRAVTTGTGRWPVPGSAAQLGVSHDPREIVDDTGMTGGLEVTEVVFDSGPCIVLTKRNRLHTIKGRSRGHPAARQSPRAFH